ncbi:MAG: ferritin-like domain-containing protein [bacterium]
MKNPATWTKADLHLHLQHALELEIWTIPLYLTALYSIKGLRLLRPLDYPDAAKLMYSVAVQEMLHIELVCNISNALGKSLQFHAPCYDGKKGIPFIHPAKQYLPESLHGYPITPQALNEHSLRLFCAIELPHPKSEVTYEHERSYNSIAEMYDALRIGIELLWDECYVGDDVNTKQKNSFQEYLHRGHHGFSQIVTSRATALKAIEAIVEQGEGADSLRVPSDYRPPEMNDLQKNAGWFKGHMSHYQKFSLLLHHHHKLPEVYEVKEHVEDHSAQLVATSRAD